MKELACVFVAGGLGSVSRWLVGLLSLRAFGASFPYGTLTVNVVGSFVMGIVTVLATRNLPDIWRLAIATGFLGGFTTYSSFNQETFTLLSEGNARQAVAYLTTTLASCLVAGWVGARVARLLSA